jgi:DUF4097 and DUF4098 domain-containing protein YvlB
MASLAHAAWSDHEEARDLALDAADLDTLRTEAGAGSMKVIGVRDSERIVVSAVITVPDADPDEAAKVMQEEMVLSLERHGDRAELKSYFESRRNWFGDSPSIRLEVRVPARMSLDVEDGSGSIEIRDVSGDLVLDDASGSITMADVGGSIRVKDGSGSIDISGAGGDVDVVDGSGSIRLRRVTGSATIEDGSGSIDVAEVSGDVSIPESGSGGVDVRDVQGRVVRGD